MASFIQLNSWRKMARVIDFYFWECLFAAQALIRFFLEAALVGGGAGGGDTSMIFPPSIQSFLSIFLSLSRQHTLQKASSIFNCTYL